MKKVIDNVVNKVVIYARYSSHGQREQSIDGQLRECYAFAQRENMHVVGEYIDRALTGRNDDRPQFQKMIKDAQTSAFNYVLVWKLDRFARNRYDSAVYKARLKKYGVRVLSATENITDTPEGIILEGMLESIAEYYSANLSKHVKRGMKENALQGLWPGGNVPFGYNLIDKRLHLNTDEAAAVKYIFEQYAAGTPKKAIIAALNEKGIKNRNNKNFSLSTISTVLTNKKYNGVWVFDGEVLPQSLPQIVPDEMFNAVQDKIRHNRHNGGAQAAHEPYILQGKAFCGHCGAPLVGESGRGGGGVYKYYACAKKKKLHECSKKNEKKGFLEWYITEQTVLYVLNKDRIEHIAEKVEEEFKKDFNADTVKKHQSIVRKLERQIEKAVNASLEAPTAARQSYYNKIELLETKRIDAQLQLEQLQIAAGMRCRKKEVMAWLKIFCGGDALDVEFQKKIINLFVHKVFVYDDKILIYYNVTGAKSVAVMGDVGIDDNDEIVRILNEKANQRDAGPNNFGFSVFSVFV